MGMVPEFVPSLRFAPMPSRSRRRSIRTGRGEPSEARYTAFRCS